ncbi:NAD-glutamate dehydrogenase domain-containing protein [uncultured Rothia sp.]|uniref:NAD-glutamate dehydrogenase domain-containing protein n=1 Tax=uncultured Rothia sp. TaxID=316088 RepID=UPI003217A64F
MSESSSISVQPLASEPKIGNEDLRAIEKLTADLASEAVLVSTNKNTLRLYLSQPQSIAFVLPIFANLGITVQSQAAFKLTQGGQEITLFELQIQEADFSDSSAELSRVEGALNAVLTQKADDDALNQLVTALGFSWRTVVVLRAYLRYLAQLGVKPSTRTAAGYFLANPEITSSLIEYFETGFDPSLDLSREQRISRREEIAAKIEKQLAGVSDAATDQFLRDLLEVFKATVRTNLYQNKETVALKMRPTEISRAPLPRPMWEIWVYSPKVEGTHLRFGMVSRGGLRWSDRPLDFRTEILGLVKAQRTKNAVIIPNGSKGGFFPKGLPDRDAEKELFAQMGLDAYKLFIGSLLDVTDNLVNENGEEKIVQPENVVILDQPDHYLVVAADKGTATFSDTANQLSLDRGFWLGDAFASGGSVGFDHKEMGITARGAWESVKRHFASIGHDTQSQDFTMVGIGGMAGDVFGNGVLLSPHIRLVAAFDSRHIFIDPNPDAQATFPERERLFNLPRAYWSDYNQDLISEGGGIFKRSDKSIEITPQIREALDLESEIESLSPAELIRAIIAAPVDLLYTGGTGTYVRSTEETDADVRDATNDTMRITVPELRVKVVGEGGNLGLTQRARIEAARHGVLLNTDAVDNSAGVETSDHEVNLKILVDRLVAAGEIAKDERAALIEAQVEEVGQQVLQSNIDQNILLQSERLGTRPTNSAASRFIKFLGENAVLDRDVEFLPTNDELAERRENRERLTSPELSVLVAYSKLWLTQALIDEGFGEDRWLEPVLHDYFPSAVAEKYGQHFWSHPLRREIIATKVANEVVDTAGIVFVFRVLEETGASVSTVVRSFLAVSAIFGLKDAMQQVRDLAPTVEPDIWRSLVYGIQRFTDRAVRKVVQEGTLAQAEVSGEIDGVMANFIERFCGVSDLRGNLENFLGGKLLERLKENQKCVEKWGVDGALAHLWAEVWEQIALVDIVSIAEKSGWKTGEVAPLYFALYERFNASNTMIAITELPRVGRWESIARASLRSDLYETLVSLTLKVIEFAQEKDDAAPDTFEQATRLVKTWEKDNPLLAPMIDRITEEISQYIDRYASGSRTADSATISVAVRTLREIAA